MTEALPRLELLRVFGSDAKELIEARERALTVHRTKDIDAAGDEVEQAARRVLSRKLPSSYYTGHGHLVDASLQVSPQIDVVIANNGTAPILFRAENGTEYFPYEGVYAFGEVKSTYYHSKRYVDNFVEVQRTVRGKLHREATPPNYAGNGLYLGDGFVVSERRPLRNPLFTFMLFVNGGDFDPRHIDDLYRETALGDLPSVICLLDRGILINAQILKNDKNQDMLGPLNANPEMSAAVGAEGQWVFVPFGSDSTRVGANFAVLWFALVTHLQGTALIAPNMIEYLGRLISFEAGQLVGRKS